MLYNNGLRGVLFGGGWLVRRLGFSLGRQRRDDRLETLTGCQSAVAAAAATTAGTATTTTTSTAAAAATETATATTKTNASAATSTSVVANQDTRRLRPKSSVLCDTSPRTCGRRLPRRPC
jgi:hypothetical protein